MIRCWTGYVGGLRIRHADGEPDDDRSAPGLIAALASDVRQLSVRANPFVLLLNLFGLWELRYARRIERWKARRQHRTGIGDEDKGGDFPAAAAFPLPTEGPVTDGGCDGRR